MSEMTPPVDSKPQRSRIGLFLIAGLLLIGLIILGERTYRGYRADGTGPSLSRGIFRPSPLDLDHDLRKAVAANDLEQIGAALAAGADPAYAAIDGQSILDQQLTLAMQQHTSGLPTPPALPLLLKAVRHKTTQPVTVESPLQIGLTLGGMTENGMTMTIQIVVAMDGVGYEAAVSTAETEIVGDAEAAAGQADSRGGLLLRTLPAKITGVLVPSVIDPKVRIFEIERIEYTAPVVKGEGITAPCGKLLPSSMDKLMASLMGTTRPHVTGG